MALTRDQILELRKRPELFIEHILGAKLWEKQIEIANGLRDHRIVVVRSCHGSGKTFLAAQLALWWLYTRPFSTVITTAPTGRQVTDLLWKEIRKSYKRATEILGGPGLGGEMLPKAPRLVVDDEWLCVGFSTDDPTSFQGWHAPGGILAIFDEAPGIAPDIWDAARGVIVGDQDRLLCIGNPTETSGPFYNLFKQEGNIAKFHISAYDVPNVQEGKVVIPGLCTKDWVDERKAEWHENTPMWQSRVMGNFPDSSDATVVPLSWAESAVTRYEKDARISNKRLIMAVDVARFGADHTVFAFANEDGVKEIIRAPKADTMETVGHVIKSFQDHGAFERVDEIRIDADGLGAGVYDRLKEQLGNIIVEMRGGMRATENERYLNRRAEWYFTTRKKLDPDGDSKIFIPNNNNLIAQLTSVKWKINSRGLIQIESKEDMKKRGVKSPDEADAVIMALANEGVDEFFFV
jgi:phage terminase large subunit